MKVNREFLKFGTFHISQVRFWEDTWPGNRTLRNQYPQLYNIVRKKQYTVAEVLCTQAPNLSWRRDQIGNKLAMWNNLVSHLATVVLSQERDEFKWNLDQTCVFSVKSHYLGLINQNTTNFNKRLWKLKTPLKIKIFRWYLRRGVILAKDNLSKWNWQGNQQCCFCKMKQYNICFLIADSREWHGLRCMQLGEYPNLAACPVCSGASLMEYLKSITH